MSYRTRRYTVSEARACIFQPRNFTDRGSEGVKSGLHGHVVVDHLCSCFCSLIEIMTREGHRQPDKHWNRFKGTVGVNF